MCYWNRPKLVSEIKRLHSAVGLLPEKLPIQIGRWARNDGYRAVFSVEPMTARRRLLPDRHVLPVLTLISASRTVA
jgi:hypothetical protein